MSNFFIDISMAIVGVLKDVAVFVFALVLLYIVLNFIIRLLKKEEFRAVNTEAYKDWVAVCRNTYSRRMKDLWVVGSKRMSECRIDKIHGHVLAYLQEPDRKLYPKGEKGEKLYKRALKDYKGEQRQGLDRVHLFAVRRWWKFWDSFRLYMIPEALLVDDMLVGDIFVNAAGFLPCLHYWRIPSNLNRKRYVDAIKTNSVYIAYEQDWDYMGNIAQRAIEAENQFLKAKGIKESVLGIFKKKEADAP